MAGRRLAAFVLSDDEGAELTSLAARRNTAQDRHCTLLEEPIWPPENYRGLAIMRAQRTYRIAAGENAAACVTS